MSNTSPPPGRRPGDSQTKAAIILAARQLFARSGYEKATMRSIAQKAGVDPALIVHFFGSMQELFVAAMMPLHLKGKEAVLHQIAPETDLRETAAAIAHFFAGKVQVDESREILIGLIRAASSEPKAADMVRQQVAQHLIHQLELLFPADEARLRASLIGSQLVGFVMGAYIIGMPRLAALSPEQVVASLTPVIYRYLTMGLTEPS